MNHKKDLLSIPEAAKLSAVSRWTIWKYVRSGELRASRTPGGHFRVHRDDLETFMREKGMYPASSGIIQDKKVLIVDDEPAIQVLYKKILSRFGYQMEIASNGFEAGTKIFQFRPDLVILDLVMPGMDGFEICSKIKGGADTSHIRVLIITGHDTEENKNRIMAAGADDYLVKPVNMTVLQDRVEHLLNSQYELNA